MFNLQVFPYPYPPKNVQQRQNNFTNQTPKTSNILTRFLNNCSIHGLQYIGSESTGLLEKLLWSCLLISSLGFSLFLCRMMWQKWEDSPVMITLDSNLIPLHNQPFPAVTICNNNKGDKKAYLRYLKHVTTQTGNTNSQIPFTEEDMHNYFTIVSNADSPLIDESTIQHLTVLSKAYNFTIFGAEHRLKQLRPYCATFTRFASFKSTPFILRTGIKFLEYFSEVPTDDGICCSFNYGGIQPSSEPRQVWKSPGAGVYMGLSVLLYGDLNEYGITNHGFDGFKVLIHDPNEFPEVGSRGFPLPIQTEMFAGIRVSTIETSAAVINIQDPIKRGCTAENHLQFFHLYSISNCYMECQLHAMFKKCLCVPFYYLELTNSVKTLLDYNKTGEIRENITALCQCPLSCTETRYTITLSQGKFPGQGFNSTTAGRALYRSEISRNNKHVLRYDRSELVMLNVFYEEQAGVNYKRDIRFGWEDFVSAIGGLLGLGVGFSLISCIECVYFLGFRSCLEFFGAKLS